MTAVRMLALGAMLASTATAQAPHSAEHVEPGQQSNSNKATRTPAAAAPASVARYSPLAAAGGYNQNRETFWTFWLHQFNPANVDYGARLENRRRAFLAQAGANPYFWFAFWELAMICLITVWAVKERIDRKDMEWQAAGALADLANYAEHCKRGAIEAITRHNDHIETCNRVIESAETGRPMTSAAGNEAHWKQEIEKLETQLAQKTADALRLEAELAERNRNMQSLAARIDDIERKRGSNGSAPQPNADLVERLNRAIADGDALRSENERLRRQTKVM